jgi:hypothetical protein
MAREAVEARVHGGAARPTGDDIERGVAAVSGLGVLAAGDERKEAQAL